METEPETVWRCVVCGHDVDVDPDGDPGCEHRVWPGERGAERVPVAWLGDCPIVPPFDVTLVPRELARLRSELQAERKLREDEERHADEMAGLLDEASPIVAAQPGEWARAVGRAFDAAFARHRRLRSSGEDS